MTLNYDLIRPLMGGAISKEQFESIEAILSAWEKYGDGDNRKLAYVLATGLHECRFIPQSENLTYTSAQRIMQVWPSRFPTLASAQPYVKNAQKLANKVYGGRNGNTEPNDGWDYRGRGMVQLTGKANYAKFSKLVGVDLVKNPDFAKQIPNAAKIIVVGMMQGLFTGKKLSDYINDRFVEYPNARAIINADGVANGVKVAHYAETFLKALTPTSKVIPSSSWIELAGGDAPPKQQTFDGGNNEGIIGETVTVKVPSGAPTIITPPPKQGSGRLIAVLGALTVSIAGGIAKHMGWL